MKSKSKSKSTTHLLATCVLLSFGSSHAAPLNGQFSWANLGTGNSDALVGLSTSKTYLENVNLLGGALTINGIPFAASGGANPSGTGLGGSTWAITGQTSTFGSGGTNPGGTLGSLTNDFIYGGNPGALTLGGLTLGQHYILTFYSRAWDPAGGRTQWLTASDGPGGVYYDEDYAATGQGALELLRYTFQATGTNQTITFKPEVGATSMHLYGFGTEQLNFDNAWAGGGDWTTATWGPAGTPNSQGANASFTAQGSPTAINLDADQTVGHVQFDGANAWTLSSSTSKALTLQADAGGLSVLSAPVGTHTIATAMTWSNDVLKSGAGTLVLSGPLADNGKKITITDGALEIATSGTQSLAGVISGSGSLRKSGAGTLTVSGRNSYTGQTTVNGGTLQLQAGSWQARPLLLADNFSATGNPNTADLNYNLANRQTGALATCTWTPGGNVQVGNPTFVGQPPATGGDYLLLAGRTASLTGLPLSTANSPGPVMISFDMYKGSFANAGNWTSFSIRSTPDGHPVAGSGEFGMLYRQNTGVQIFNNGAVIADFASTARGGSFAFYLTDSAGTGSPFAGNGTKVTVTQGGSVLGTYTLNTGMSTSYVSFGSSGGVGGVDNLFIGSPPVLPVTTPVTIAATSTVDLNGFTQRVASLADSGGGGSVINSNSSTPAVLALNPASGSTTFTGVIGGGVGTISLAKSGAGTQVLGGSNTYAGVTMIHAGTLQLGDGTSGHDGSIAGTSIVNNSVISFNLFGASSYAGVISGSGSLSKTGNGTLTLNNANSYTGTTTINGGTLALGAGGSLNSGSTVHIGAGGTFDVSAIATYPWPVGTSLTASGSTGAAAMLTGGTTVSLDSQPATLNITPTAYTGDVAHPALTVVAGVLDLGTSTITVNNNAATPLGVGDYTLITGGTVTGTPTLNPVIGGAGLLSFTNTSLVVAGGNLILHVTSTLATTTTSISLQSPWTSTSTYGDALEFHVTVIGNVPGGTVTVKKGGVSGTTLGSASLSGGAATVTLSPLNLLQAGTHDNIVAVYDGDVNNLASISAALAIQQIGPKTVTVSSPTAATKYYDATTVATLGGTLTGVVAGDTLEFGAGTFASAGPGTGIGVTFSIAGAPVANYTLAQPGSITADILASAAWTGNASDTLWDTAGNWLANLVPGGANITANFTGRNITMDEVVELDSSRVIGSLSFNDTDPVNSPANWILGNNVTPANTLTLAGTSPTVTVNALGDGMAAIINAVVAGTNGLTKVGNGTLSLAANNIYSGGTTINAGTLQVGNGFTTGNLGSGNVVNNANLALNYSYGSLFDLTNNLSGSGTLHVISGDLRTYAQGSTGTITVDSGGDVTIWAPGAVLLSNDFVLNSMGAATNRGAISHDGGPGLVTLDGSITLAGDSRIGVGGSSWNSMTLNGKVTGAGVLHVFDRDNADTETRLTNNTNDYSGGTIIEQGRLSISQANALGTGPVTITGAGSQLLIDELTATIPNHFTLGGGGNPTSHRYGNGSMVFHNDGTTATLSGTVTLNGDAKIRHYSSGGTTIFSNPIVGTGNLTFEGGGGAANHNQMFTLQGGPSTYAGNTTIRASDGNPIVRLDGGFLPAGGALSINDFAGYGTRNAVFDLNGHSQTLAGLNGTVSSLGVFVTNSGATPSTLTVTTTTLDSFGGVIGLNTTTATTGQTAGGADITLVKNGTGTLTLSGANTYTGPTAVNEGSLLVGGFGVVGHVTIANAGFETPAVSGYLYTPPGASWTFNTRSGICSNTFNPTAAPEGARCAFLQSTPGDPVLGEVSQTVSVGAAGSYTITFKAEGRGGIYGPCGVIVKVDGNAVGTWDASAVSQTQWQSYQATVNLAAGSHTLSFVVNNTLGGDRSLVIDDVQMAQTGAFGSLGNTSVTVASAATFGGIGTTGGAVTWGAGAKASFTVTMAYGADNYTPMTIAGVMTCNATQVDLNLPNNLPNGTYTLAASGATPVANGAFPAPVLASGSYVEGSTGVITMDQANKKLILTVSAGSLYQTWAGVGGPAFTALNSEGVANGMAWMLGATSPTAVGTVGLLPAAGQNGSGLTLHFLRVHDIGTAKLYLQYSNNLGTWNAPGVLIPANLSGTGTLGDDIGYVANPGTPTAATDDITLTIPNTHASGGKLFGRLTASEN